MEESACFDFSEHVFKDSQERFDAPRFLDTRFEILYACPCRCWTEVLDARKVTWRRSVPECLDRVEVGLCDPKGLFGWRWLFWGCWRKQGGYLRRFRWLFWLGNSRWWVVVALGVNIVGGSRRTPLFGFGFGFGFGFRRAFVSMLRASAVN